MATKKRKSTYATTTVTKRSKYTPFYKRMYTKPNYSGLKRELKQVDIKKFYTKFTPTGSGLLLNGLAVGSDLYQRVGRQVYFTSILINWLVQPDVTVAQANDHLRLTLVWDKNPNGIAAVPALSDIYRQIDNAGTTETNVYSARNEAGKLRFKILKTEHWYANYANDAPSAATTRANYFTTTNNGKMCGTWRIPIKSLTQFTGTGATMSDIGTGALYMYTDSESTNKWEVVAATRCFFYDD